MSGRRKVLRIFMVLSLVVVIVMAGGWFWIKAQLKDLADGADNVNMPFTQTSIEEWFEQPAAAPGNKEESTAKDIKQISGSSGEESTVNHPDSSTGGSGTEKTQQVDPKDEKLQQIKNKYKSKLVGLQGEYESRLNGLLASAKADYRAVKDGGSKAEIAALAQKYVGSGKALEADCDRKFNTIINNMEAELKSSGLSTAIVNSVREGYEGAKNERRKYFLGKALNYM